MSTLADPRGIFRGEVNAAAVQALYRRFQALDASTAEHSRLLQVTLEDTGAALQLVKAQLGCLLLAAVDEDDPDDEDEGTGEKADRRVGDPTRHR